MCTPTKDRPTFLTRAIRSVQAQTYTDWQHVIYDVSAPPIYQLIPPERRYLYQRGEPQGPAIDFNIAHSLAEGEIMCSLSDDDELPPVALKVAVESLGDSMWLLAKTEIRDEKGNHFCYRGGDQGSIDQTMSGQYMLGGAVFWRRELLDAVGLLNPEYDGAADFDFYARFVRHTPPVIIPDVLLIVHDHPLTDSRVRAGNQRVMSERIARSL